MDVLEPTAELFIDTQKLFQLGYDWRHPLLAALLVHVRAGRVKFLTTSVTIQEARKKWSESLMEVERKVKGAAHLPPALRPVVPKRTQEETEIALKEFFETPNAQVLSVSSVDPELVFERFFNLEPPFSEKKRCEFRDAFVAEALRKYAIAQGCQVYVVSEDGDWEAVCRRFGELRLTGLEALLASVDRSAVRDAIEEGFAGLAATSYEGALHAIAETVRPSPSVSGKVEDAHLEGVEVEDWNVTEVDQEKAEAVVVVNAVALFGLTISHGDEPYETRGDFSGFFDATLRFRFDEEGRKLTLLEVSSTSEGADLPVHRDEVTR